MPDELTGTAAVRERFAALPLETYEAGATVLAAGSATGRLLVLEDGLVEVVRDGVRLAELGEPGTMFGELALLLGRPHTCDVLALEPSTFRVAEAAGLLREDRPGARARLPAGAAARPGQPRAGRGPAAARGRPAAERDQPGARAARGAGALRRRPGARPVRLHSLGVSPAGGGGTGWTG
jgi:hypothetical protein